MPPEGAKWVKTPPKPKKTSMARGKKILKNQQNF